MSFLNDFDRSFVQHTLSLVQSYEGPYDATIMVNCLLGLLLVPKESFLKAIPEDPISSLKDWGIDPSSIRHFGRVTPGNPRPETLRGLVINLRHAIAHFRIRPVPATAEVHSFEYKNDSGLEAVITITEMRAFVAALAKHLACH